MPVTIQGTQRRNAILLSLSVSPGQTFLGLCRRTGLAPGVGRHHVQRLKRQGLLETYRYASCERHYVAGTRPSSVGWAAVLADPHLARLWNTLNALGRSSQRRLLDAMAPWARSTTQTRLDRLVKYGAATARRHGRFKSYEANNV